MRTYLIQIFEPTHQIVVIKALFTFRASFLAKYIVELVANRLEFSDA